LLRLYDLTFRADWNIKRKNKLLNQGHKVFEEKQKTVGIG
jgi:hypothetical protein